MSYPVNFYISSLADHGIKTGLVEQDDRVYVINGLLNLLDLHEYTDPEEKLPELSLEEILAGLLDYAGNNKLINGDSVVTRDLFDTALMGVMTPRPSDVIKSFAEHYKQSPKEATDWFYRFCLDCDYIRSYRIKKDARWVFPCKYGVIDITINLSKPEKDPKMIAAMKKQKQSGYPLCNLCHENEGYEGSLSQPARQTLRQIPLKLAGADWFLQYSPYSYYNEHCIVLSKSHTPMKINRALFDKALDFTAQFPHYFVGSNADLPIVGGSILTHDHMQGGNYDFAMAKAPIETELIFKGYEDISAGIVNWPLSVIRLNGIDRVRIAELAEKILDKWRSYSDESAFVFAETNGEPHNTITPIARRRGENFELDLVLRNNITTEEHPLGLFHPHAELHNIKKENIGLIEVMGLAVLPSRLKTEMSVLAEYILSGDEIPAESPCYKHKEWYSAFANSYSFTSENVIDILRFEIGKTFVKVLEDAGVYKCTEKGREQFLKFCQTV